MAVVTRWFWVRHAPVINPDHIVYGASDMPVDVSETHMFAPAARALPRPAALLDLKRQRFDTIADRLDPALQNNAAGKRSRLLVLQAGLKPAALKRDIRQKQERLADRGARLTPALERILQRESRALDAWGARLASLSHKSVLRRGFVLVRNGEGQLVRSGQALDSGDKVELEFADMRRSAIVDGETPSSLPPAAKPAAVKPRPKPRAKPPAAGQGTLF